MGTRAYKLIARVWIIIIVIISKGVAHMFENDQIELQPHLIWKSVIKTFVLRIASAQDCVNVTGHQTLNRQKKVIGKGY